MAPNFILKSGLKGIRLGTSLIFLCLSLFTSNSFADGVGFSRSGQVNTTLGFRSVSAGMVQEVFVYVNAGERISLDVQKSFEESAGTSLPLGIDIYSPSGLFHSYTASASSGAINSYLSAQVSETGIYSVRLAGGNRKLYWRYDLNALPGSGTSYVDRIGGRVFTETLLLAQLTGAVNFNLFHLNQLGHQYTSNWFTYNGVDSRISTNIFGVNNDISCEPLYKSKDINYTAPVLNCGRNYKQFFTSPDPTLPAASNRWITSTSISDWLKPVLMTPAVTIGIPTFSGNPTVTTPARGIFTIPITGFTEIATLAIDANGNGVYNEPVDRKIPFLSGNSVDFDGLDGLGQAISCGMTLNAKVLVDKASEIHFVLNDVERIGGLTVTRQNGLNSPNSILYWDDTDLGTVNSPTDPATADRDGTAGVNSNVTGGVHGWVQPAAGPNFSWGNDRYIDNWATFPIANVEREFQVATPNCPPVANDDQSLNNPAGSTVTLNILSNDLIADGSGANPSNTTVAFTTTGLPAGSSVSGNTITVTGEGIYNYNPATGALSFTPQPGFLANPTPLNYVLTETATGLSDPAVVTITYNSLPVKLVSFNAVKVEAKISLTWATTEEVNSDYFEVHRSNDGKSWKTIGIHQSNTETKSLVEYQYWDLELLPATAYYRLKMVDLDQTFAFSSIVSVRSLVAGSELTVYPVPTNDVLYLSGITLDKIQKISIVNTAGITVQKSTEITASGIRVQSLQSGLYILRITLNDGTHFTHKFAIGK
jgi:hypothetical protein